MLKDKTKIFLLFSIVLITLVGISAVAAVDADDSSATTIEDASSSTAAIQANVDTKYDNNKNIIQKDVTQTTSTEKDVTDKADVTSNKTVEKTTDKTLKGVDSDTGIDLEVPATANAGDTFTVTATTKADYEGYDISVFLYEPDDPAPISTQSGTVNSNSFTATFTLDQNAVSGTYTVNAEGNDLLYENTFSSDDYTIEVTSAEPVDTPTVTITTSPETVYVGDDVTVTWTFTLPDGYAQSNLDYSWRITVPEGEDSYDGGSLTTSPLVITRNIISAISGQYQLYGEISDSVNVGTLYPQTYLLNVTTAPEKIDAIVFVEPDDEYTLGESSTISGTLEADADDLSQGTVNIVITYSDSTTVELTATTDEDGYFDAEFTPNVLGTASVTATLVGDDKFNEAVSDAETFEVTGSVPVITVDVLDPNDGLLVGQPVTITGTYTENGVGKDDVTVKLNINGEDLAQTATTENGGKFTFTYTPETPGYYDYYAYTDENTKSTTESFGVDPLGTTITLNVPEQEIYVDDEVTIEGTLTDENNNPVASQSLTVTINDVPINEAVQTDTDGKFSFPFTQSEADDYTINVIFDGTELYAESELNPEVTVTVLDKIETIVWIDGTLDDGNYITEGLTGSVSLMDANDMEGIPDATITITAVYAGHEDEPQTFTVTTDENGDALINEEAKYVGEVTVTATVEAFDKYAGDDDQATVTIITAPTSINLDGVEATCTDKVVVDGLLEVTVNHAGDTEGLAGQTVTISVAFDDAIIAPVEVPTEDDGSFHAEIATNGNYGQATITVNYAGVEDLYDPASETATTNVVKSTKLFITGDESQLSEGLQGSGLLQVNDEAANGVTGTSNKRNPLTAPADETGIAGATVTITAVYPGHEDAPQTFDVTTEDDGTFSFTEAIPFDDLTLPATVALSAEFAGDSQYDSATATADEPAVITEDEPKDTFIDISGVDDTTEGDIIVPGLLEYVVDEDEGTTAALAGKPVTVVAKIGDEIIGQATVNTEPDGSFTATIPSNNNYGLVDITATFAGDDDYKTSSDIAQTTILMPTDLFITADDGTVRDGFEVSGYLTKGVDEEDFAGATINVEVTYNDGTTAEATATTADDGTFNVLFENPVEGPVTVVATFEQTSEYAGSEATDEATITNPKLELTIEYPIDDYYYYDEVIPVEAYLYEEDGDTLASGEIPVTITVTYTDVADPVVVDTTAIDGAINAVIPAKDAKGPATVTITTTETDDYLSASEDFGTEIIAKSTAEITVEAADAILPDSILVTGTLTNVTDSANPVAIPYVPVTITIDNRDDIYTTETDENGEFSYEIPTTEEDLGDRTVTVTFEDVDYETVTDDDVATVTQRSDVDIFFELDDEYEVGDEISINGFVTNVDDDEAVADLELTLTINDEVIGTTTTNADGEFEFTYPATVAGPLTVTVSSQQTDDYNEASASDDTVVVAKVYDTSIYFNTEDTIDSPEELPLQGYVVYIDDDDEEQALANAPLTITVTINGEVVDTIQTTTDDEGHFDAVFDTTDYVGTATIEVSYAGADNYTEATASDETTITNKALSNMILAVDTPYYLGVESTIDGSLFDDETDDAIAGADITVTVTYDDDSTETFTAVTESDGSFTVPFTPTKLGDITISAEFDGNDDYKATSAEEPSTVEKQLVDSVIDYYPEQDEIFLGDDLIIDALLHADDDDETPIANAVVKVKVTINDQVVIDDQNTTDANGRLSYVFTPETEGTAVVELTFEGNDDYTESEADGDVLIKPARKDVTIVIPVDDKYPVNEALEIPVNVFDEDDEAVVNQEVTVVIKFSDDSEVTLSNVTDENGDLNITVPQEQLVVGPVSIVATIEDSELYNDAEETATTEIVPVETAIDYIPETPIYSGETLVVDAILHTVDDDESPICGEDVIVKITLGNEVLVTQTVPSDLDEGRIYYEFDTTGYEGTAVVELIYEGNNYFNATTATAEVEIKPARTQPIILLEPDEKYQANAPVELSGLVYADDDDETPISGATVNVVVTFNDDSTVELSGETDDEGYFTVTIPQENLVVGPVTITATIEENDTYNESTTDAATEIVPAETMIDFELDDTVVSGDELVIDAYLHMNDDDETPIAGATVDVYLTIGDDTIHKPVETTADGNIATSFETTGLVGDAIVVIEYIDGVTYDSASATQEVEILPPRLDVIIALDPDDTYPITDDVELSGEVFVDDDDSTPAAGAIVNVVVTFSDDSTVELSNVTAEDGSFTIVIPKDKLVVGPVTIVATIEENDTYSEATTDAETEIVEETVDTFIDLELDSPIESGETLIISAILHEEDDDDAVICGEPVIVKITLENELLTEVTVNSDLTDGSIYYEYDTTGKVGTAVVELIYEGNNHYNGYTATDEVQITAPKELTAIAVDVDDTYVLGSEIEINGVLYVDDDEQAPIAGEDVTVTIKYAGGLTVSRTNVTDDEGSFTVTFPANVEGIATITAEFAGNDAYKESSDETTTEIVEETVDTYIDLELDSPIETGDTLIISAILHEEDDDDAVICGEPVIVKITLENELLIEVTVNSDLTDGSIYYEYDTTGKVGTAVVELIYEGNNHYNGYTATGEVIITAPEEVPTDTVLSVQLSGIPEEIENDTVLDAPATIVIEGQLLDSEGNVIPVEGLYVNYTIVVVYADGSNETIEGQTNVDEETGDWMLDDLEIDNAATVNVTVFFEGNGTYTASDVEERHFSVGGLEPILVIDVDPNPAELGSEVTVTARLINNVTGEPITDGYINIIVEDSNGEQVAINASQAPEGVLELTFTPESLGEYTVTVDEDEYLLSEETTLEVIKPEVATELVDVSIPDELYEGKETDITGQLVDDEGNGIADQPITVTVANEDGYEEVFEGVTDDEGNFVIPINPDTFGPVTITVSYPGNETEDAIYKPANESKDAEIMLSEYTVTLDELEPVYDYNTTVNITGKVTSIYDPLDIDEITLSINDEEVTVPVNEDGTFKYEFPGTTPDTYNVFARVNDETISNTQTFDIDKIIVEVTVEAPADPVHLGDGEPIITGTLTDMITEEPIADATIAISVNGEEVANVTTDSEGKYSFTIPAENLTIGENTITVVAVANDMYMEDTDDTTLTVERQDLIIEIIKPSGDVRINDTVTVVVITSADGKIVTVDALNYTFKDKPAEEVPMSGTHGEYTVTSDVNGTFTLNVSRAEDLKYNYAENTTTITFRNLNTAIESNDNSIQEAKVFDEVELSVNVVDENGVPVGKGTVEFTYDGKVIGTADVTDGTATITTVFNDSGRKDVTVKFTSEDTYADSTSDYTVVAIIDEATTNLTVDPIDEIEVGKPTNVTGKVTDEEGNPLAGVPVSVKVGDKVVNGTTGDDGKFSIPVTPEDANVDEVTVSVPANEGYAPAEETIPVDVEKQDANITVDPVNKLEAGKETPVTGKVTDENGNPVANAPVTVKVGDQTYTGTTDDDGKFSIPVTPEKSGNTPVDVSVGETDNTKPANKTTTANVGKQDANLTVDSIKNAEAGKPTNVTGKVTDEDGNPVAGAPVTVKVGDKTYTGNTGEDGKFTIPVTPETSGSQPVQVSVGQTATTKPANKTSTANVGQQDAKATVDPITDAKVGKEVPVTGKVTDEQGNPVAGAPVNVTVDGKTYTGTTDEDGNYNIPVTPTKSGSLPVNVNVGATNQTKAAKANTTAKVTKQDPTVTVNPINGAEAGKSVPVTGSVTDEEGKPVANAPVNVTVDGKTYTGTTDKDGKFSIPVTPTKSGTLPVNVNVGATNNTNAAKANTTAKVTKQDPTVTVDPVTAAEVGKSVPVTGSVTDEEGKPVANAPVTVKVGDKTYNGTTDKDGKFSIPVTPTTAGDNPVTVTVPATNTTNAKTVKDSITVSKVATTLTVSAPKTVTVGDTYTINGTLKGADNKAIANAKVSINVDGKVLTATTNSAGIFNVTSTAADVGKEEVTAVFAGDAKYDASNVANATVTVNKLGTKTTVAKVTGKALNNVTITATVNDAKGNAIKSGAVYFTDSNNNVLGLANVTNGKASIVTSYPEQFNGTIKAQFLGSDNYTASTGSVKANITKQNVVIKADPITGQMNDMVTITAKVTDENGNPVQSGNVVFKINGQTVKDANGTQLKVRVVDGTVTAEVNATQAWKGNSTLTIRYLGDNTYNASENTTKANIAPRKAQVVLITDKIARGGDQIVLTAFVTDNGEAVNGGQVIFKVNGETIKDASGKAIVANVVNGTASIVYDIRPGMSAKDLNMSVVLSNKLYDRTENSTILTIVRSDVYFNTSLVYAKDGKAHIKATLRDAKGELCVYNTDIALKVGGKTQLAVAKNGIVDCEIDTSFLKPGVYELYYVAGLNNRYNEVRMTNALIVE
jgi:protocatechuate 3,4-dioxygenase beta subunit